MHQCSLCVADQYRQHLRYNNQPNLLLCGWARRWEPSEKTTKKIRNTLLKVTCSASFLRCGADILFQRQLSTPNKSVFAFWLIFLRDGPPWTILLWGAAYHIANLKFLFFFFDCSSLWGSLWDRDKFASVLPVRSGLVRSERTESESWNAKNRWLMAKNISLVLLVWLQSVDGVREAPVRRRCLMLCLCTSGAFLLRLGMCVLVCKNVVFFVSSGSCPARPLSNEVIGENSVLKPSWVA